MYFCTAFLGRGAVMVRIEILSIGLKKNQKKLQKYLEWEEKGSIFAVLLVRKRDFKRSLR